MPVVPVVPARRRGLLAVLLGLLAAATLLVGCGRSEAPVSSAPSGMTITNGDKGIVPLDVVPAAATTDLPTVTLLQLPPEALVTLSLIEQGGPYPYSKDGVTFQNRERLLPRQASGFYREYTVETPGSNDRGARRIVTGEDGSRFYTDDHYDSFREVVSGSGS
jgi:ribonuclease T1